MTLTAEVHDADRVVFLDNLRYLMVLLVVVLHASVSYCNMVPWWAVLDKASVAMDLFLVGSDIFLMPVLFFIAGYFGVSSFQRHGAKNFIKKKFKRLGVPLLISAPIAGCLFAYTHHYTRGSLGTDPGLWHHWTNYMVSAFKFHIGLIPDINHFSHSHLWFMSTLLFFFLVFVVIRSMLPRKANNGEQPSPTAVTNRKIYIPMILVVLGSTLSLVVGTSIFASPENPQPWFIFANLIQFQPHRVVMYALYFGLGVYAFHAQWFSIKQFPGHLWLWSTLTVVFFIAYIGILKQMMAAFSPGLLVTWLSLHCICCMTILATLLKFAVHRWNRPNLLDSMLAANSYHIYILHFIVTFLLQLLMLQWTDGPVLVKFSIVSLAAIMISLGLSHYLFRPYPVRSIVGVAVGFIIALAVVNPAAV